MAEGQTVVAAGGMYNPSRKRHNFLGAHSLDRFWRFLRENGSYLLATNLEERLLGYIRNGLISRKLRVQKIKVGPRSYLRGLSSIEMGEDFSAEEGLWLEAIVRYNDQNFSPRIVIGNHVRISRFVHITATHLVQIGDNVLMGSKVMVTDHNHGQYSHGTNSSPHHAPSLRPLDDSRRVVIGQNVWLGDGVVVTAGSSVGEGAVIGANSVVSGNIPAFTIAAGIPAVARKRFNFDSGKWCNVE